MCGDFEESDLIDEQLFNRLLEQAKEQGVVPARPGADAPADLSAEEARTAYLQRLFQAGLSRAVNDAGNLPQGERMDAVAGQALAFARLAGFLAGQLPPEADLFRAVTEALMQGHRERQEWERDRQRHYQHAH